MIKTNDAVDILYKYDGTPSSSPRIDKYPALKDQFWMETYNHDLNRLGRGDCGGPWRMFSNKVNRSLVSVPLWKTSDVGNWAGGLFTNGSPGDLLSTPSLATRNATFASHEEEARGKAPTAIARVNPSTPMVDLGTAVGETITGGLPSIVGRSLWKERTQLARGAGSEYLNYQFGWVPLVNDIRDFAKTVIDSNTIISQYENGSGQRQHRRYTFPDTSSAVTYTPPRSSGVWPGDTRTWRTGTSYEKSISDYSEDELWFSGCFRYYLPKSGLGRYTHLARKLYGASLTPSTLWNMAPWSWAADWFGNVGDVMTNISYLGSDASVMEYGYMMRRSVKTRTIASHYTGTNHVNNPFRNRTAWFNSTQVIEYKSRYPGSPYSFSVDPAPLTTKQIAILAALGLSRS